ncbi:MAG: polysaccharide biosynthesis/export family protein, partial [Colwellia sp.]
YLAFYSLISGCSANILKIESPGLEKSFAYSSVSAYYIGVDDVLQVNIWKNPDLSLTVPVRPDGKISVPLLGDIIAGGKEPMQVALEIKEGLARYIREPQVTVILSQLRSHEFISRVRITGAVNSPSSIPFRQGMTVLDAMLQAGGANDFAAANKAKLYRKDRQETKQYVIYLDDILHSGMLDTNYPLLPGDIITVPERLF